MPVVEPTLPARIAAAQAGDADAVAAIYAECQPLVERLLRRYEPLCVHFGIFEDLPGETFIAFANLLEGYDARRGIPFTHYVNRMLPVAIHTVVRRHCRALARERALNQPLEFSLEAHGWRFLATEHPEHQRPMAEAALSRLSLEASLRRALHHLEPRQAYVFVRHSVRGEDFATIARALGSSSGAVRTLYVKARQRLHALLRREAEDLAA